MVRSFHYSCESATYHCRAGGWDGELVDDCLKSKMATAVDPGQEELPGAELGVRNGVNAVGKVRHCDGAEQQRELAFAALDGAGQVRDLLHDRPKTAGRARHCGRCAH